MRSAFCLVHSCDRVASGGLEQAVVLEGVAAIPGLDEAELIVLNEPQSVTRELVTTRCRQFQIGWSAFVSKHLLVWLTQNGCGVQNHARRATDATLGTDDVAE